MVLADHLETVPRDRFDLGMWKCETTACAVGHGAECPALAAEGLRMNPFPVFKDKIAWEAVEAFFEIGERVSFSFFLSSYYDHPEDFITPAHVAARIRKYLADND